MNLKILNQAQHIIDLRRFSAENEGINNKIKALQDEEYKCLNQRYITLMIEDGKNGRDEGSETLKVKARLKERERMLGLSTTPQYYCPICNDMGRINGDYCKCLRREINNLLIKESGFSKLERFEDAKFDIFDNPQAMRTLYQKMQQWCDSDFKKNIIYIGGDTGVGKTHLMSCIANKLIENGRLVTLTTSYAMNQDFNKSYSMRNSDDGNEILDKYLSCEVLFIDDLGTELRRMNVTNNYLYLILNERKTRKRPTVITSNLTIEDVRDYYDERIFSRIVDKDNSIYLYLNGNDLRQKNK